MLLAVSRVFLKCTRRSEPLARATRLPSSSGSLYRFVMMATVLDKQPTDPDTMTLERCRLLGHAEVPSGESKSPRSNLGAVASVYRDTRCGSVAALKQA